MQAAPLHASNLLEVIGGSIAFGAQHFTECQRDLVRDDLVVPQLLIEAGGTAGEPRYRQRLHKPHALRRERHILLSDPAVQPEPVWATQHRTGAKEGGIEKNPPEPGRRLASGQGRST